MKNQIRVAVVGLDTSHSIEFTRRLQAPDCPENQKVPGMQVVSCLRFATPFQNEDGLNARQKQMEAWGVRVTARFDEAVADCDAIMIEINDPAYHLEYFKQCAGLGKPLFLDKPMADTLPNAGKIAKLAKDQQLRMFSASSLRFTPQLKEACGKVPAPLFAGAYGPLGQAPAGSSVVWYGVHTYEMLERIMGPGATRVFARNHPSGVVVQVEYPNGRYGLIELTKDAFVYGGCLRTKEAAAPYVVDMARAYSDELVEVAKFFAGGNSPVALDDTLEIMRLFDATERSLQSGKPESVRR